MPQATDGQVDATASPEELDPEGELPGSFQVVQRWFPTWLIPGALRLPASFADAEGLLPQGPMTIEARILDTMTGDVVVKGSSAPAVRSRQAPCRTGCSRPPSTRRVSTPSRSRAATPTARALQVLDPAQVTISKPGDPLKPFDTPTLQEPDGVDPICTLLPDPCPFHEITLTEALASGKPVAFLVGTPAYCATGTCSPALEGLVALADEYGDRVRHGARRDLRRRHRDDHDPARPGYGMDYEPSLFLTDAQGIVVNRLDAVFNQDEIRTALDAIV